MFDSPTLSVSELATRWSKTPRQILDFAQSLGVPLYFLFDGLAFDISDHWHRHAGDLQKRREIEHLDKSISGYELWIKRSARGENGEYEQRLTSEEIQEKRVEINAFKRKRDALLERLEQREIDRKKMAYRGLMRAAPETLFDIAQQGSTPSPRRAFHPQSPVKETMLDAKPIWDGRLMALESSSFHKEPQLTIDSLCAVTAEVIAIEAHLKAKAPAPVESDSVTTSHGRVGDREWVLQAQTRAREIIKESKVRDCYPSQENLGDKIATEFRKDGIVGADGKPLSGATIKRHALKGISSAVDKQLSTTIERGK